LKIAEILRTHIKTEDVASRLGGDEFAVLLPGMSLPEPVRSRPALVRIRRLRLHGCGRVIGLAAAVFLGVTGVGYHILHR